MVKIKEIIVAKKHQYYAREVVFDLLRFSCKSRTQCDPNELECIKLAFDLAFEATLALPRSSAKAYAISSIAGKYTDLSLEVSDTDLERLLELADDIYDYATRIRTYRNLYDHFGDQILKVSPSLMWVLWAENRLFQGEGLRIAQ